MILTTFRLVTFTWSPPIRPSQTLAFWYTRCKRCVTHWTGCTQTVMLTVCLTTYPSKKAVDASQRPGNLYLLRYRSHRGKSPSWKISWTLIAFRAQRSCQTPYGSRGIQLQIFGSGVGFLEATKEQLVVLFSFFSPKASWTARYPSVSILTCVTMQGPALDHGGTGDVLTLRSIDVRHPHFCVL